MSKRTHGNKEARKPKQVPATAPATPAPADTKAQPPNGWPRPSRQPR